MTTYRGPGDSANSGQSVTVLADQAAASATAAQVAQAASEIAQTASETAQGLAETAQGLAEAAQTAAETALDSFDDRYLGAKASDPTLDNDGNALITGALYFNTTSGKMMVYGGAAWVPSSVQGIDSNADATAITISSNEDVGIGTVSPANVAGYTSLTLNNATNGGNLRLESAGVLAASFAADTGSTYLTSESTRNLRIFTNSSERVRIDSTGNVGIGTSSPATTLDIQGAVSSLYGTISAKDSTSLAAGVGGSISFSGKYTSGGSYSVFGSIKAGKTNATDGQYDGYLAFSTRPTTSLPIERMRIDSAGNVGIGVVPEAWNSTFDALQVGGLGSIFATASQAAGGATDIGSNVYYDGAWKYIVTDEASRYRQDSGTHQFFTAPSGTADTAITWTERMRIDGAGNVTQYGGVTYLNGGQLIVARSGNEPYVYFDYGGTEVGQVRGISGGGLRFTTGASSTERMRIDSTGSVGIEGGQLNLYQTGAINSIINAKYSCRINIDSTNIGTGEYFSIGHNQTTINSSNELFRVQEDGNVGIGTTSPQYPLDVQSTTTNGIRITSTDAGAAIGPIIALWRNSASPAASDALAAIYFQGEDSVSNATNYARINAYIEDPTDGTEDGALTFSTSRASVLTEAVRITGSGDVGIGVTPTYPLHLQKSINGYLVRFQNTSASTPYGVSINFSGASPDNNTQSFLNCNDSTTTRCIIYSDGDLANHDGTYGTISDAKFKTDITPARSQWEDIKALGAIAVNYRMKTDIEQYGEDAHYLLGWIAQDVQKVSPGLVKEAGDPEDPYLVLKQSIIGNKVAIALAEALVRIEQLESTIASLQQQ